MTDTSELMAHVQDSEAFHLPFGWVVDVPQPLLAIGIPVRMTKFMLLELVAAVLMLLVFLPLARRIATGRRPRGRFWNFFETIIVFVRDEVARPAIGRHDADRFLPFLWTVFFFILFCNLLGLLPGAGSPTGATGVTGTLAMMSFLTVVGSGVKKMGPVGFWKSLVPPMELPLPMAIVLTPVIFVIEVSGLVIRHMVLAIRLFANMFAGHLVMGMIIAFIPMVANLAVWYVVTPASVFGAVAVGMLELFVAFLQAYIFTFLSALFIGLALHPH
jgi:F-type H+-transporting ATPase subunit a